MLRRIQKNERTTTFSKRMAAAAAALTLVLIVAGCGGGGGGSASVTGGTGGRTGKAKLRFVVSPAQSSGRVASKSTTKIPSNTASIEITVSGTDMSPMTTDVVPVDGVAETVISNIPIGLHEFEITAFDANKNPIASRIETAVINPDEVTLVYALLGMTITGTAAAPTVTPTAMTFSIGDRFVIKNNSEATASLSVEYTIGTTSISRVTAELAPTGIANLAVPSTDPNNTALWTALAGGAVSGRVLVNGTPKATFTVEQGTKPADFTGDIDLIVSQTLGEVPFNTEFSTLGSFAAGAEVTTGFCTGLTSSSSDTASSSLGFSYCDLVDNAAATKDYTYQASYVVPSPANYYLMVTVTDGANTYSQYVAVTATSASEYVPPTPTAMGCSTNATTNVDAAKATFFNSTGIVTETQFAQTQTYIDAALADSPYCPDANFMSSMITLANEAERVDSSVLYTPDTIFPFSLYNGSDHILHQSARTVSSGVTRILPQVTTGTQFSAKKPLPSEMQAEAETNSLPVLSEAIGKMELVIAYLVNNPDWTFDVPRDPMTPTLGNMSVRKSDMEALLGALYLVRGETLFGLSYYADMPSQLVNGEWVTTWTSSSWAANCTTSCSANVYMPATNVGTMRPNGAQYMALSKTDFINGFSLIRQAMNEVLAMTTPTVVMDAVTTKDLDNANYYKHYLDELIDSYSGTPTAITVPPEVECWRQQTYSPGYSYLMTSYIMDPAKHPDRLATCLSYNVSQATITETIDFSALFDNAPSDLRTIAPNKVAYTEYPNGPVIYKFDPAYFQTSTVNGMFPNLVDMTMFEHMSAWYNFYFWNVLDSVSNQPIDFSTRTVSLTFAGKTVTPIYQFSGMLMFSPNYTTPPTQSDYVTFSEVELIPAQLAVSGYATATIYLSDSHMSADGMKLTPVP